MQDKSQIVLILDRSGSMRVSAKATIDGVNEFIKGQQAAPGEAWLKLVQFDHEYMSVYNRPIEQATLLTNSTFEPRGTTALLDAIGRCITEVGEALSNQPEAKRPSKVVVVIVTDGFENASTDYTREKVFEMVEHQKTVYNWEFIYLGANQDAIAVGASLGISVNNSMSYATSDVGTRNTYAAASANVVGARGGQHVNFTRTQRQAAVAPDDPSKVKR